MVVHVIVQAIDGGIGYLARSGSVPVEGVDGEEWICTC
jgi:hypothetical protein